jgi:hypothetical protein
LGKSRRSNDQSRPNQGAQEFEMICFQSEAVSPTGSSFCPVKFLPSRKLFQSNRFLGRETKVRFPVEGQSNVY